MSAPLNPTRNYSPTAMGVGGGSALSYLADGKPWFSYMEVPRINRDPWVSFLKRIWVSPLRQLRWTVKATSDPVAEFVDRTVKRFWVKSVPGLMRRYFDWGFAPGGVEYREKRGRWLLDLVRPVESFDARVLVRLRGKDRGGVAGFSTDTTGPVVGRYAFWFAGHGAHGRHYDRPPVANLYDPWLAKNERGGMLQLQYLLSRKHAVRPAVGKHPAGDQTWQDEGGTVRTIRNQQLMLSALEIYEAGGNIALENGTDEHGHPLWDITPAEAGPDVKQIADAVDALDIKMGEGVGLPAEVVRAATSGSGFSGRSIPNRAWLGGVDEYAGLLLDAFDRSPLRGMVHANFGPRADYEIEPISLVQDDQQQGPAGRPPPGGQPAPPPKGPPRDLPADADPTPDAEADDGPGDPFELSAYSSQSQQDRKSDARRSRNATRFVLLAILRLQERAHAGGDPHEYAGAIEQLAELAGNPDDVRAILDGEGDGDRFDMAWQPYLSRRNTEKGEAGKVQIGWFDDETQRVVYGTRKPGERREKAQADAGTADDLLGKIAAGTPEEQAGHLRALADHLPALTVAKLREVRAKLSGAFGGRRAKADGMAEALAEHFRLRAGTLAGGPRVDVPVAVADAAPAPVDPKRDGKDRSAVRTFFGGAGSRRLEAALGELKAHPERGAEWAKHLGLEEGRMRQLLAEHAALPKAERKPKGAAGPDAPAVPPGERTGESGVLDEPLTPDQAARRNLYTDVDAGEGTRGDELVKPLPPAAPADASPGAETKRRTLYDALGGLGIAPGTAVAVKGLQKATKLNGKELGRAITDMQSAGMLVVANSPQGHVLTAGPNWATHSPESLAQYSSLAEELAAAPEGIAADVGAAGEALYGLGKRAAHGIGSLFGAGGSEPAPAGDTETPADEPIPAPKAVPERRPATAATAPGKAGLEGGYKRPLPAVPPTPRGNLDGLHGAADFDEGDREDALAHAGGNAHPPKDSPDGYSAAADHDGESRDDVLAPAPKPTPPAVGSPEWEARMADASHPNDLVHQRDDTPPPRAADAHDREAEAAAEERQGRMEGWAADRPDSAPAAMHGDAARQAVEDAREAAGKPRVPGIGTSRAASEPARELPANPVNPVNPEEPEPPPLAGEEHPDLDPSTTLPPAPPWVRPPDRRVPAAGMSPAGSNDAATPEQFRAQYAHALRTGDWDGLRAMMAPHPEGGRPGGYLPNRDAIRDLIGGEFGPAAKEAVRKQLVPAKLIERLIELGKAKAGAEASPAGLPDTKTASAVDTNRERGSITGVGPRAAAPEPGAKPMDIAASQAEPIHPTDYVAADAVDWSARSAYAGRSPLDGVTVPAVGSAIRFKKSASGGGVMVRVQYGPATDERRDLPEATFDDLLAKSRAAGLDPATAVPAALAAGHGTDKKAAERMAEYIAANGPKPEPVVKAEPAASAPKKVAGGQIDGDLVGHDSQAGGHMSYTSRRLKGGGTTLGVGDDHPNGVVTDVSVGKTGRVTYTVRGRTPAEEAKRTASAAAAKAGGEKWAAAAAHATTETWPAELKMAPGAVWEPIDPPPANKFGHGRRRYVGTLADGTPVGKTVTTGMDDYREVFHLPPGS